MTRSTVVPWLLFGTLMATAACGTPRSVRTITGSGDQVKFVYARVMTFSSETGLVQCSRTESGDLQNCREMEIIFEDDKKKK